MIVINYELAALAMRRTNPHPQPSNPQTPPPPK